MASEQRALLSACLTFIMVRLGKRAPRIEHLQRLSGGATQETWRFEVHAEDGAEALILRRAPSGHRPESQTLPLAVEAQLIRRAGLAKLPVPEIRHVLRPDDECGTGFIMSCVAGEALPKKILSDPSLAHARALFANQVGTILAGIHRIDAGDLPLHRRSILDAIRQLDESYRRTCVLRPVFELALVWLKTNIPRDAVTPCVVHGDFRNGNLILGPAGIRAVLDWELSHIGDPAEDLAWICVNSWRFGQIDHPVGGLGAREGMLSAYGAAGGQPISPERLHFWEVAGTLYWGIICAGMVNDLRGGHGKTIERAAISRRASEAEIDLLRLLLPRGEG